MGPATVEGGSGTREEAPDTRCNEVKKKTEEKNISSQKKKSRRKLKFSYLPKIGCLRIEKDNEGNLDMEVVDETGEPANPTHLIILVNGIIGSAENWKYAAKQFLKKYPRDVVVHCSKANSKMLTLDGIDVTGQRLADEVIEVIKRHPSVQKISFVGHSLGGLVARYAIAKLYGRNLKTELSQGNGNFSCDETEGTCVEEKYEGKIGGLEPMNFITSATPHLGSRWHKQVPAFCGFYPLEKLAVNISWVLGRTGKHLMLVDSDNGKPPLLLQMVTDSEDIKFMSALQSFKRRVAYANAGFDHIVGWSTSSLRRRNELPKRRHLSRDAKYPHIVHVKTSKSASPHQEVPSEEKVDECKTLDMEEQMLGSLTKMSWERFDVSFRGSKQRFLAHNTIQVQNYCMYSDGADVIQHMIDSFLL